MQRGVFVSLGSNLGDRAKNLEDALAALEQANHSIVKRSPIYETEPQDVTSQPWFLNMAVEIETASDPFQLIADLQRIEHSMGRVRQPKLRSGPRLIDLDILLFGTQYVDTPGLTIPHPRMWDRRFVLQPLADIAPDLARDRLAQLQGQAIRRHGE